MEKAKAIAYYDRYSIKNGLVEISFRCVNSQLSNALSFAILIGKPIKLGCSIEDSKYKIGTFSIHRLAVDRDGETVIVFKSNKDSVNLESVIPLLEDEVQINLMAVETDSY